MNIIALDASLSSTGYCIMDDNKEVIDCGKITTNSKNKDSHRISFICKKCEELIIIYDIKCVVIEGQFVSRNKNTAMKLSRLFGAIMYLSQIHDIDIISIEPNRVRSILLHGDCDKEEMAKFILDSYEFNCIVTSIGPYSDKSNKAKTSDIYDSISIGMAYMVGIENGEEFKPI